MPAARAGNTVALRCELGGGRAGDMDVPVLVTVCVQARECVRISTRAEREGGLRSTHAECCVLERGLQPCFGT